MDESTARLEATVEDPSAKARPEEVNEGRARWVAASTAVKTVVEENGMALAEVMEMGMG